MISVMYNTHVAISLCNLTVLKNMKVLNFGPKRIQTLLSILCLVAYDLFDSHLFVFFKPGDQIIEVNGTYLKGMDQEDVIKIFRDLPSSTQMKIRRSKVAPQKKDSQQETSKRKESVEKTPTQDPVPLPKPPENRRRSSQRGKVQPVKQEVQPSSGLKTEGIPSDHQKDKEGNDSRVQGSVSKEIHQNGSRAAEKAEERTDASSIAQTISESKSTKRTKPIANEMKTTKEQNSTKSDRLKDELGDNLIIPSGYRKLTVDIRKPPNSTLGLSLVPSYGKLKGYFQVIMLQYLSVCIAVLSL